MIRVDLVVNANGKVCLEKHLNGGIQEAHNLSESTLSSMNLFATTQQKVGSRLCISEYDPERNTDLRITSQNE